MGKLFSPFRLRDLTFRNRIFVSPMCQYSSQDGFATDWHLVHLGSRAVGGAALVMVEATAVSPEGRISPGDLGIWSDDHVTKLSQIAQFIKDQGAAPGIQLAHAGRKGSTAAPWEKQDFLSRSEGGWETFAPSSIAFDKKYAAPTEMTLTQIAKVEDDFQKAIQRSLAAGFQVIELHMAHGYLLNEFLSPVTNRRTDQFGGDFSGRTRLPLKIARSARDLWPQELPVFLRISATDWVERGWDLPQSIEFSKELKKIGIDLVDCSSGGIIPNAKIPMGPGFQVPFADTIRRESEIATGAVGDITEPQQAEEILRRDQADAVFIGREFLRNPYWPIQAAQELNFNLNWPKQYERAKPQT